MAILPFQHTQIYSRMAAGAAGFNPNAITGLKLWFAATNGPLTSGVPSVNNDLVDTWTDLSPSAKNLTAALDARPTLITNAINGLPVVRFNGTANVMVTASMTFAQPAWFFFVLKLVAGSDGKYLWDGTASGDDCAGWQEGTTGAIIHLSAGTSACERAYGTTNFVIVTAKYSNAASSHQVNNGTEATGTLGTANASGLTLGATQGGASSWSQIDVAEYIGYSATLAAGDVTKIVTYLSSKYGITIS